MMMIDGGCDAASPVAGRKTVRHRTSAVVAVINIRRFDTSAFPLNPLSGAHCTSYAGGHRIVQFRDGDPAWHRSVQRITINTSFKAGICLAEDRSRREMRDLRFPPPRSKTLTRIRVGSLANLSFMSLGKAIVALYVITFLAAVISARTLADKNLGQPEISGVDSQASRPPSFLE
jgi:hypothetical protein